VRASIVHAMKEEHDEDEQSASLDSTQDEDSAAKKKKRPKKKKPKGKANDASEEGHLAAIDENCTEPYEPHPFDAFAGMPEEWVDITQDCQLASQCMGIGEMIESPHFRLFDAMSAIEIMDPKMDSGFNNSEDITLEGAVESGIIAASLKHDVLVAIWDHLLMYFSLWLEGHTIVQTLWSCLYLQDLQAYVKPIPLFAAFIDGFLVACRAARGSILRAGVFDDEDFLPNLFGLDLEMCVHSIVPKEVKERIEKECKALRNNKAPAAKAVLWRLEFIAEFMLALTDLGGNQTPNGKNHTEAALRRLTTCLGLLEKLSSSCDTAAPDSLKCFDASINKKLLVPGPPRTVEPILESHLVFSVWTSRIHELILCCNLSEKPLAPLLEGAITYKGEPNVLPRSIAFNWLLDTEGLVQTVMLDSLELFLFPRDAIQHCKKATDAFMELSENLFSHLLKLSYYNRARRFRRLAHVFSDFNSLQHKAWNLDEELKQTFGVNLRYPRPCWVWIMEQCLQMMLTKLFLGFELELYDEAEYHMIYWYCDYLYGLRVYNLNELHHAKEQPLGGDKKKGKKERQPAQQQGRAGQRPKNPPPHLLLLEATQSCVRGLFRLLSFCLREELLKSPPAVADGLGQRFVLRFRALELFRLPHLPSFRDFQASSASAQAPVESRVVLEAAQTSFGEATQLLDRIVAPSKAEQANHGSSFDESVKSMRRIVVANQLAITQLLQRLISGKRSKVEASLQHHPHFVSLRVQAVD